jgi:hypothetical protein
VVNGILDMSKMETGNFEITPEPFVPAPAIVSCCDLLALKARDSGVAIKTRIGMSLPEVVADRRAFNQILINLISNAIKFTPRDGRVTVSAHCDGSKLTVVVEDTGVGIGEDDLPRVGEAFFQARASYDRRHDGTGLGLSIVKGLVRLHGGEIAITSRLGKGTQVTVRLPLDCHQARHRSCEGTSDRCHHSPDQEKCVSAVNAKRSSSPAAPGGWRSLSASIRASSSVSSWRRSRPSRSSSMRCSCKRARIRRRSSPRDPL